MNRIIEIKHRHERDSAQWPYARHELEAEKDRAELIRIVEEQDAMISMQRRMLDGVKKCLHYVRHDTNEGEEVVEPSLSAKDVLDALSLRGENNGTV